VVNVEDRYFKVALNHTHDIPLGIWTMRPSSNLELDIAGQVKQAMEIIIKHGLSSTCIAVGKNPDTFFLPERQQLNLLEIGSMCEYYVSIGRVLPATFSPWLIHISNRIPLYNTTEFFELSENACTVRALRWTITIGSFY